MDQMTIEGDLPIINRIETRDTVEESRLSGPVRADNARDRKLFELEIQGADGNQAAEALGYSICSKEGHRSMRSRPQTESAEAASISLGASRPA